MSALDEILEWLEDFDYDLPEDAYFGNLHYGVQKYNDLHNANWHPQKMAELYDVLKKPHWYGEDTIDKLMKEIIK